MKALLFLFLFAISAYSVTVREHLGDIQIETLRKQGYTDEQINAFAKQSYQDELKRKERYESAQIKIKNDEKKKNEQNELFMLAIACSFVFVGIFMLWYYLHNKKRIEEFGINRIEFLIFLFVWTPLSFVFRPFGEAVIKNGTYDLFGLSILAVGLIHLIIFARVVYYRHKNADVDYGLAVICCFVPFPMFWLAPVISGLWHKPENSIGNLAYIKNKYRLIKNSGSVPAFVAFAIFIVLGVGYIYNIVWIIDVWQKIGTFSKMFNIASMFFPPLGGILGIYHFF